MSQYKLVSADICLYIQQRHQGVQYDIEYIDLGDPSGLDRGHVHDPG